MRLTLSAGARRDLPYYRHPEAVGALLAVPILSAERLSGLIVLDRLPAEPFSDAELDVAQTAATQIMRVMVNENHLRRLDKSQNEYFLLSEVSKALSQTLDRAGLLKVALEATRSIAPFDFAAIVVTRLGETTGEVVAAWPEDMGISGSYYESESNLIDWVVRNNSPLVYHDFKNLPRRPTIFCKEEKAQKRGVFADRSLARQGAGQGGLRAAQHRGRFLQRRLATHLPDHRQPDGGQHGECRDLRPGRADGHHRPP